MKRDRLDSANWLRMALASMVLIAPVALAQAPPRCGGQGGDVGNDDCVYIVVDQNAITEEPDPILFWGNPGAGGDGPPHLVLNPVTGEPLVCWASLQFVDSFEIACTEWTANGWAMPYDFLTAPDAVDDLDPRLYMAFGGRLYVAWWRNDGVNTEIRMSTRDPNSGEYDPDTLVTSHGRRPSILFVGDTLFVGFERLSWDGQEQTKQVVVFQQTEGGEAEEHVIATTTYTEPLNIRLQYVNGVISMNWDHTESLAGYTEYSDGRWGASPDDFDPRNPNRGGGGGGATRRENPNLELGF